MPKQTTELPRILIVGTLPYNPNESSRALDTYFHNFPKDKLRMIFSNSAIPQKGHCGSLFQITDYDVLQRLLGKEKEPGRIFEYDKLGDKAISSGEDKLKRYKKKNAFRFYARKRLWSKNRWLSEKLTKWVDEFAPEAIYICFSDDYFILNIAYHFAKKYNIPIIAQIGDDYYFKKNKNLFLRPYLRNYKKLFRKIMRLDGFGVYISDKLANKYNESFSLQGYPFYLSTNIKTNKQDVKYEFNYFGKVELGRDKSLAILGDALKLINNSYRVNVYTSIISEKKQKFLSKHNCVVKEFLPYEEAQNIINSGAFNILASGFSKKDIGSTRYSLSTKVSDLLSSCGPIIAIGPDDDGAIDFLKEKDCCIMINNKKVDIISLEKHLKDKKLLKTNIEKANEVSNKLFDVEINRNKFEKYCLEICKR